MGNIYRAKRELIKSSGFDIPKKHNLNLDTSSDFRSPSGGWEDTYFTGKKLKVVQLPFHQFEYLYIPYSVIECYIHTLNGGVEPVLDCQFIPLYKIDKLILIKPTDVTVGHIYFQYFLTDTLTPIKILDVYESIDFTIPFGGASQTYQLPFPTYEMKLYLNMPTNPTSIDFYVNIHPVGKNHMFELDKLLATTEKFFDNIYRYDFVGGSGAVTDPHIPFPSWSTHIRLRNNDVGVDIVDCQLKVISWED